MQSISEISMNSKKENPFKYSEESQNDSMEKLDNSFTGNNPEIKKLYQEFVKTLLKVKFERMHNSHKGQQICEKLLFKECMKRKIAQSDWQEFIVHEFKNTNKYSPNTRKRDTKNKNNKYIT
jgi:excinuclease UvrABC ATPase subunit